MMAIFRCTVYVLCYRHDSVVDFSFHLSYSFYESALTYVIVDVFNINKKTYIYINIHLYKHTSIYALKVYFITLLDNVQCNNYYRV